MLKIVSSYLETVCFTLNMGSVLRTPFPRKRLGYLSQFTVNSYYYFYDIRTYCFIKESLQRSSITGTRIASVDSKCGGKKIQVENAK